MSNYNYFKRPKLLATLILMSFASTTALAFDANGMTFQVLDEDTHTVQLGWKKINSDGSYSSGNGVPANTEGEVKIPSSVVYNGIRYSVVGIAPAAFLGCDKVTSVHIPKSIINVDGLAKCTNLTAIHITDLEAWCRVNGGIGRQHHLFMNNVEIRDLVIPTGITEIKSSFSNCVSLTSVTIPNSVTTIGAGAFSSCTNLVSLTIPNSVTEIGGSAFKYCSSLSFVSLPNSLTSIRSDTFAYCGELETVVLGESPCELMYSSFLQCNKLSRVYSKTREPLNGSAGAFGRWSNIVLYVPEGTLSTYTNLKNKSTAWSTVSRIEEREAPVIAKIIQNNNYINAEVKLIDGSDRCVQIGSGRGNVVPIESSGDIIIPPVVTDYNGNIYKVTSIGKEAFSNCKYIASISIPRTVNSIDMAFENCESLESFIIHSRFPPEVNTIPDDFFRGLPTNAVLYVPAGTKKRYEALEPWKRFSQIIESSPISIGDISARLNSQENLPVYLNNTETVEGLQFKLTLPEGVTVVNDNGMLVTSTSERTEGMTIMGRKDPEEENSYLFALLSLEGNAITGNEGAIMNVKLNIAPEIMMGGYEAKIKDVYMTTDSYATLNPAESTSDLTVTNIMLGDVNNDGVVDALDASLILQYVAHKFGDENTDFIKAAADANSSGEVDALDASLVLQHAAKKIDLNEIDNIGE